MRKKNTSDRMKLKTKYFNIKKRSDRKRKLKKDMKNNPNKYHKKKSDPGVPNSAPFKKALLDERDQAIAQKEAEKKRKRELVISARAKLREASVGQKRKLTEVIDLKQTKNKKTDKSDKESKKPRLDINDVEMGDEGDENDQPMEEGEADETSEAKSQARTMAQTARNQLTQFKRQLSRSKNFQETLKPDPRFHNWSDKVYYRQVKQVVDAAQVILEVVDARDPLGTRCTVLESIIRNKKHKKLVIVLNKADLVPKKNLEAWLTYLRAEAPCTAFKSATPHPKQFRRATDRMRHLGEETMRTSLSMGGDVLLKMLKNYARGHTKYGIDVGVVGLPNVGKSSLINSMKKAKACDVAPVPGCTKTLKRIKLDHKLHLLDCPGVVLPGEDIDPVEAVLKNLVKIQSIRNAEECALEIFRRSDSLKLALFYGVRKTENGEEFLSLLAKRNKKLLKKGAADKDAAAKKLIYDWNHGILKYYTEPPTRSDGSVSYGLRVGAPQEFDLDPLTANEEHMFLSRMDAGRPSVTMKLSANAPIESCFGLNPNEEEESTAGDENVSDSEVESDDGEDLSDYDDDDDIDNKVDTSNGHVDGEESDASDEEGSDDEEDSDE